MEFTIKKPDIIKSLKRVQGVIGGGGLPILQNILLTATEANTITVAATDLEIGMSASYPAKVKKPGVITVSGKKMFEIVRELPGEDVLVKVTGQNVAISSEASRFKLIGISGDDYPQLPVVETDLLPIDAAMLRDMIRKTFYAAADRDARYVLNGLLIMFDGKEQTFKDHGPDKTAIRMVATDGHRLASVTKVIEGTYPETAVIVPRKAMNEIRRSLDEDLDDKEIKVGFTKSHIIIKKGDGLVLFAKLIDGKYPEYQRVIPLNTPRSAGFNREALMAALKRVSLMASDKIRCAAIELGQGTAVLTMKSPELGESTESITAEHEGESTKIGFNSEYLMNALSAVDGEIISLNFNTPLEPCLVSSKEDLDYRCVVMPMRTV